MTKNSVLNRLILALPELTNLHAPDGETYGLLKAVAIKEVAASFSSEEVISQRFEPFGELIFPYTQMGAINSLDLFGLDELIIFSFYWVNRNRYKRVLDLGANLGLHSLILSKCGFQVTSLEPDPTHFSILRRNLDFNDAHSVTSVNVAVSVQSGEMDFTRVLGNTTGSHLTGSKQSVYGEIEQITTKVEPFTEISKDFDLVKMDIEGHEKIILCSTTADQWQNFDMIVEIGSQENAIAVFNHFKDIDVNLFSQKTGWSRVRRIQDVPTSHREGSLFLTAEDEMPWG